MSYDWHARYHQDALDGMLMLTLEERGAYNTLLDLIYHRDGPVPDDDRWLAGWMGCSLKKWKTIRAALLVKGKIHACQHNDLPALMNDRASLELETRAKLQRNFREQGSKGGKTKANNNKNNVLALPPLAEKATPPLAIDIDTTSSEQDKPCSAHPIPAPDPDRLAWNTATTVLIDQGGMTEKAARSLFGRLLSTNGLEPRDLLPAAAHAMSNGTKDPQGYLTGSAKNLATKRSDQRQPKRVGFV